MFNNQERLDSSVNYYGLEEYQNIAHYGHHKTEKNQIKQAHDEGNPVNVPEFFQFTNFYCRLFLHELQLFIHSGHKNFAGLSWILVTLKEPWFIFLDITIKILKRSYLFRRRGVYHVEAVGVIRIDCCLFSRYIQIISVQPVHSQDVCTHLRHFNEYLLPKTQGNDPFN